MTFRELTIKSLIRMKAGQGYSNLVLDAALKNSTLERRDISRASMLFYGVLERELTLECCIAPLCSVKLKKLSPTVLYILKTAFFELLYTDTPDRAVLHEAVELTKKLGQPKASGLVNAVLRAFLRSDKAIPLPKSPWSAVLSAQYSVAEPTVKLLMEAYGREATDKFLASSHGGAPVFLRVNTTKTTADALMAQLAEHDIQTTHIDGIPNALKLTGNLGGDIRTTPAFVQGLFHVQDLACQLCVMALDPHPDMTVLDVCAAPGGKSFTAAQYMQNRGHLLSLELHPARVDLITKGAQRLGLDCIKADTADATVFDPDRGLFDRVLCDVPCSGLGVLRRKPDIRYKTPDTFADLPTIQRDILANSSRYVKAGGLLVYSTCTLNPAENEQVVELFLREHPEFTPHPLPHILGEGHMITLMNHNWDCDGFFIACMQRKEKP